MDRAVISLPPSASTARTSSPKRLNLTARAHSGTAAFGRLTHSRQEETSVTAKLEFLVTARRVDASDSVATCKDATLTLDTALAGRRDALNPAGTSACRTQDQGHRTGGGNPRSRPPSLVSLPVSSGRWLERCLRPGVSAAAIRSVRPAASRPGGESSETLWTSARSIRRAWGEAAPRRTTVWAVRNPRISAASIVARTLCRRNDRCTRTKKRRGSLTTVGTPSRCWAPRRVA
jgi:hypothetical protein